MEADQVKMAAKHQHQNVPTKVPVFRKLEREVKSHVGSEDTSKTVSGCCCCGGKRQTGQGLLTP